MPTSAESWKAAIGAAGLATPAPVAARPVPKLKAKGNKRPTTVKPTAGAPRTTSAWDLAIKQSGLGGGSGKGVEAPKYGKLSLAGMDASRRYQGAATPKDEGWSLGGFLSNVGGDIKDIAFGLPGAVELGVKQVAGVTALPFALLPGSAGQAARGFAADRFKEVGSAFKDTAQQTVGNWNQVLHGNFKPLYEDPVFMGLDAASLVTGGQAAVLKGAKLGHAAGVAKVTEVAQDARVVKATKGVKLGKKKPVAGAKAKTVQNPYPGVEASAEILPTAAREGRYGFSNQPPVAPRPAWLRQAVEGIGDESLAAKMDKGQALADKTRKLANATGRSARYSSPIMLEREAWVNDLNKNQIAVSPQYAYQRRLRARTPVGRAVQAPFVRAGEALREPGVNLSKVPGIETVSAKLDSRLYKKASRQDQERAIVKGTQTLASAGVRDAADKIRRASKDVHESAAVVAHARGYFTARKINGKWHSPLEMRDMAIATARKNFEDFKANHSKNEPGWKENEETLKILEEIPDDLVTLEGDSKSVVRVREAAEAARKVGAKLTDAEVGHTGLSKRGWRNIEGERATMSQRILQGNAKFVENAGRSGRVVVPEAWSAMLEERGIRNVKKGSVRKKLVEAAEAGKNGVGHRARTWLLEHHPDRVKAVKTERQAQALFQEVADGTIKDGSGRTLKSTTGGRLIAEDASHALGAARNKAKRVERGYKKKTVLWRVTDGRGAASHWVPADDGGGVPKSLRDRGLRDGERLERAQVPEYSATKRQGDDGLVRALPPKVAERLPREGDIVVEAPSVKLGGSKVGKGGSADYGFRKALEPGGLMPDEAAKINRQLAPKRVVDEETGAVSYKDTAVNQVARQMLASGDYKLGSRLDVPASEIANKVIADVLDRRLRGKIPLDKNGLVDWDALEARLYKEPELRAALNNEDLLSTVPVDRGAIYIEDIAVGPLGRHKRVERDNGTGLSPVGGLPRVGSTEAKLASRLGQSHDASSILLTWDKVGKTVANHDFFGKVLNDFAVKNENGDLRVFDGTEAQRLDDKQWAVVSKRSMEPIEAALRDWNPQMGDNLGLEDVIGSTKAVDKNDLVYVVPREIGDEIRWQFSNPSTFLQHYDSFLGAWRGGVLSLAPRWYINNYIGNSLFYGMFTGGDLASLRAAKGARDKLPYEIEGNSLSQEGHFNPSEGLISRQDVTASKKLTNKYFRATEKAFRFNTKIEALVRRAAYIHAVKKVLKDEGKQPSNRGLGLSVEEKDARLVEAVAQAPEWMQREGMRMMKQWMGDYQGLSRFERNAVRRVIPFYSWIRVINTWLFGMPFRSPLRAEALSLVSRLGREAQGDRSYLPWWEQGRISLPGGFSLRTSGMNPLASVVESVSAATGNENAGIWDRVAQVMRAQGGGVAPPISAAVGAMTGKQLFGNRDYTAPLGFGGTVAPYGRDPQFRNAVTGQIDSSAVSGNPMEDILQTLPFMSLVRDAAAFGERPYDSATTLDLLRNRLFGGGDANDLYQPEQKNGGSGRNGIPGVNALLGMLGTPVYRNDDHQERLANWLREMQFQKDTRSNMFLKNRQRTNRSLLGGEDFSRVG